MRASGGHAAVTRAAAQKPAIAQTPVLLDAMTAELHRAFTALGKGDGKQAPPYFLSYSVGDADMVSIRAQYGALVDSSSNRARVADIQVRLGDPKLDNTHGSHRSSAVNSLELPLVDDREALARTLQRRTIQLNRSRIHTPSRDSANPFPWSANHPPHPWMLMP